VCCLFAVAALIGPRALYLVYWLVDPASWGRAFDNFLVPFLGFVFLPWTTIFYVFVFPFGIDTADWLLLFLGLLLDITSLSGGLFGNRDQMQRYYRDM
jgi:hypothetical protein